MPGQTRFFSCRLCRKMDNWAMARCTQCKLWFHHTCVNVGASVEEEDFVCPICIYADHYVSMNGLSQEIPEASAPSVNDEPPVLTAATVDPHGNNVSVSAAHNLPPFTTASEELQPPTSQSFEDLQNDPRGAKPKKRPMLSREQAIKALHELYDGNPTPPSRSLSVPNQSRVSPVKSGVPPMLPSMHQDFAVARPNMSNLPPRLSWSDLVNPRGTELGHSNAHHPPYSTNRFSHNTTNETGLISTHQTPNAHQPNMLDSSAADDDEQLELQLEEMKLQTRLIEVKLRMRKANGSNQVMSTTNQLTSNRWSTFPQSTPTSGARTSCTPSASFAAQTMTTSVQSSMFNPPPLPASRRTACTGSQTMQPHSNSTYSPNQTWYETPADLTAIERIAARQVVKMKLPKFNGLVEEFPVFLAQYEHTKRLCSPIENLSRLTESIGGDAYRMVHLLLGNPNNVEEVIEILKLHYGRPDQLIDTRLSAIEKEADVAGLAKGRLESIVKLSMLYRNLCAAIETSGMQRYFENPVLIRNSVKMLHDEMKLKWASYAAMIREPNVQDFSNFLRLTAEAIIPFIPPVSFTNSTGNKNSTNQAKPVHVHHEESKDASLDRRTCFACQGHCKGLDLCPKFKEGSIDDRWHILKTWRLCSCCLKRHKPQCGEAKFCGLDGCQKMHHHLLHKSRPPSTVAQPTVSQSANCHQSGESTTFRVVPVKLTNGNKTVEVYAFLDEGSSLTMLDQEIAAQLGLRGEIRPLTLKWTGGDHRIESNSRCVNLTISSTTASSKNYQLHARTVENLDLPAQSLDYEKLAERYEHLRHLPMQSYEQIKPQLLIGMDHYRLSIPREIREGGTVAPLATKTRLGWCLAGKIRKDTPATVTFHHCECTQAEDSRLDDLVREYFNLESMGITRNPRHMLTSDEHRANDIMESTMTLQNGRYTVGLPWKYNNVILPDSFPMALSRLNCLERKMKQDPKMATTLVKLMEEYQEKGYIRKLSESEIKLTSPLVWYLPMFVVFNPNKPAKIRPVWDGKAKVNNVSLNDVLLKGEDLNCSLLNILIRFREHKVAVTADIEQMFHRVQIRPEDQQAQRFLWRNGDASGDPEVYALTVVSFGNTSSPYQALYVMRSHAQQFQAEYPQAVKSITENHYMDDLLDSFETVAEAVDVSKQIKDIHATASFNIRNWLSNEHLVCQELNGNPTTDRIIPLTCPDEELEKVLGMFWHPSSDTITFSLKYNKASKDVLEGRLFPTKREILKTMMSIYDPLGLLENFKVILKLIQRRLWLHNIGWDEEIPSDLYDPWNQWLNMLPGIETLRIPRCYLKDYTWSECTVDIHTLVDASAEICHATVYLRITTPTGVSMMLIAAKSKSAPLKPVSVPRLELTSAVVGVRLTETIIAALRIKINKITYWSDSLTFLCWLHSSKKLMSFVAFRVGEIREKTDIRAWRYVPTKLNIADNGTKFKNDQNFFDSNNQWFSGPEFLYSDESTWPAMPEFLQRADDERASVMLHEVLDNTIFNFGEFKSWNILLRTTARIVRISRKMKNPLIRYSSPLTSDELNTAEKILMKIAQADCYSPTITILKSNKPVTKQLPLFKQSPFLDNEGILRSDSRIVASPTATFDAKYPIILPRRHAVTKLIVADQHEKALHQFSETAVNELRQRFYIPSLRRVVKEVKLSCASCTVRDARPKIPIMAPLPPCRIAEFCPPFTHTGVDFFGPYDVVIGRRHEKRWGVMFVCTTTTAVHLEMSPSLSTDAFLITMRNFTNRRGEPRIWYSDQGKNFEGANNELRKMVQSIDFDRVEEKSTSTTTKWIFNPASAPSMGGIWERQIRSAKSGLRVIINPNRTPTPEILQSALIEVEQVLNSKPLFFVPIENADQEALTPNHFLLGASSTTKPLGEPNVDQKVFRKNYQLSQHMAQRFWQRFVRDYRHTLLFRPKWLTPVPNIQVDDIVIIMDENDPKRQWPKGRVLNVKIGTDQQVRSATIQTNSGIITRPTQKLAKLNLMPSGDFPHSQGC